MAVSAASAMDMQLSAATQPAALKNGGRIVSADQQGQLTMQDFYSLIAAQLKYQDPSSSTDESQYMSQMVEFGMLKQLSDLSTQSNYMLAASVVGKQASYAHFNSQTGVTEKGSGTVDSVNMTSEGPVCVIGGKHYNLSEITQFNSSTPVNQPA